MAGEPGGTPFVPTAFDLFAQKVDSLFTKEEQLLSDLGVTLLSRLTTALSQETLEPKKNIYTLQLNALMTMTAALELWRRGFLMQEGVLIRNALEAIATSAVLNSDKQAYDLYKKGLLHSSKAITRAKAVWPVFGESLSRYYGFLSEEFTHLGDSYRSLQVLPFNLKDHHVRSLRHMLSPIIYCFHFLEVLSELTCYDFCARHLYWERVGSNAFQFKMTDEAKDLLRRFAGETDPD